jgi:hypothetical protein
MSAIGSAQRVMTTAEDKGCLCPGGKEIKSECCPPPDKKK